MALEWCLRLDVKPSQIVDPDDWPEVASVEVALNYIRRQPGELHVEVRFLIDESRSRRHRRPGGGGRRGCSSSISNTARGNRCRDNDQLRTYAVGARQQFGRRRYYRLTIIQPRAAKPTDITEWRRGTPRCRVSNYVCWLEAELAVQDDAPRYAPAPGAAGARPG